MNPRAIGAVTDLLQLVPDVYGEPDEEFWRYLAERAARKCGRVVIKSRGVKKKKPAESESLKDSIMGGKPESPQKDWEEMVRLCDTILDEVEQLPDKAWEFGESVAEKVKGIRETIEKRKTCTDRQRAAVENMYDGVRKWLDREECPF